MQLKEILSRTLYKGVGENAENTDSNLLKKNRLNFSLTTSEEMTKN